MRLVVLVRSRTSESSLEGTLDLSGDYLVDVEEHLDKRAAELKAIEICREQLSIAPGSDKFDLTVRPSHDQRDDPL